MPSLRLLSVDAGDPALDRPALVRLIAAEQPDLACVHGSPSGLRWRSISAALARRSGLVVVGGGRTGGANLIMSGLGVDVLGTRDLRWPAGPGRRSGGAALAVLRVRGHEFVLAAARLAGSADARREQAEALSAAISGLVPADLPAIISAADTGTGPEPALTAGRTAAGGGLFVDDRITVATGGPPSPSIALELP